MELIFSMDEISDIIRNDIKRNLHGICEELEFDVEWRTVDGDISLVLISKQKQSEIDKLVEKVIPELKANSKIKAIAIVRDQTGASLYDAKRWVDDLMSSSYKINRMP